MISEAPCRDFFSVDRLHPSELGHRHLAAAFARQLIEAGFSFTPPSLECDRPVPDRWEEVRWLVTEVAPWLGRRARDLGPWAAHKVVEEARVRRSGDLRALPPQGQDLGVSGGVEPVETVPEVEVQVGREARDGRIRGDRGGLEELAF